MKNKKVIIFDFDGVIADSFEVTVKILKKLCRISWDKNDRELGRKDSGYFRMISSEELFFKMPKWKLFIAIIYARYKLAGMIGKIKPADGIEAELKKLKDKGYILGIISSNYAKNIEKFLEINGLDFFDFVYSSSVFLKKEKKLRKVVAERGLSQENIVFVGDETRDIAAAKAVNLKIVAASWGFTSEKVLKKHGPDFIASRPEELSEVISRI